MIVGSVATGINSLPFTVYDEYIDAGAVTGGLTVLKTATCWLQLSVA